MTDKNSSGVPGPSPAAEARDGALNALIAVIDDMTVERDEQGLVRAALEHMVGSLASAGVAFLIDAEGQLGVATERGLADADRRPALELAASVLRGGRALVRDTLDGGWFAVAPVSTRKRPLGVLVLRHHAQEPPAPPCSALEALGKQLATGLENRRLFAQVRDASQRTDAINRMTATLTSGADLRSVVPEFSRELARVQGFDRLMCGFVNETGDYIEAVTQPEGATWGLADVMPVVGSGPGSVVSSGKAYLQPDLGRQPRFIEDARLVEEGIRSYVLLPLLARSRCVGVLALGSREPAAYDDATLARLQPLVDSVALALDNVRLLEKTREQSIMDELTPLYNSRFFHQMLDRELKLVDRYNSVLSLIFIDLDHFKPINDRHGHLRGSRVLREVGFLIRAAVRETDYPARYGGDEFVVVLPQTERADADKLADKLRGLIEDHVFLEEEGIDVQLGASLGVASYPRDARTKAELIRVADERMYADKAERKTQG